MDAAQGLKFEEALGSARTDSERLDVLVEQAKAQILCSLSTKMHIKGLETELADGLKELAEKMDRLHGSPRLKEDFFGWLRCNYQWIIICLLAIKATNLVETIRDLVALFR